jgi:hypothetical protein
MALRHPLIEDLDLGLIDVPPAGDSSLSPIEPLQQERCIMDRPAMHGRVINGDAPLGHHLL